MFGRGIAGVSAGGKNQNLLETMPRSWTIIVAATTTRERRNKFECFLDKGFVGL